MNNSVNVLGTRYKILRKTEDEDEGLKTCDGYCDHSVKQIVVVIYKPSTDGSVDAKDFEALYRKILRHEIIHAFFYESGLWENSEKINQWATNDEMTDWIAIQFPKMQEAFVEAGCEKS